MRRSGLSRHIVVSMSLMVLAVIVMVILSSYLLYAVLVNFYPYAEEPTGWAPTGPELVWMAAVTLLGLAVAVAASVRLSQRILTPLNSVVDSIGKLAGGDLGARAAASDRSLGEVALLVDESMSLTIGKFYLEISRPAVAALTCVTRSRARSCRPACSSRPMTGRTSQVMWK
mgnify:CR=1 FL=1